MKTIIILALFALGLTACDNQEKTDHSKPYETSDTATVHPRNSQADSAHHQ